MVHTFVPCLYHLIAEVMYIFQPYRAAQLYILNHILCAY